MKHGGAPSRHGNETPNQRAIAATPRAVTTAWGLVEPVVSAGIAVGLAVGVE